MARLSMKLRQPGLNTDMMRIACPNCGLRDEREFAYGGEAHIDRPELDCDDEAWEEYLFLRANPKGEHAERWVHVHGCGVWFNLIRHTVTHEVIAVYMMGVARP